MWKPEESLDDFLAKLDSEMPVAPPRKVRLHLTGDIEVVKPLISPTRKVYSFRTNAQPLWFRQAIAVGSVGLVMIAFVLISAVLIGINEPGGQPEVAVSVQPYTEIASAEIPVEFEIFAPSELGDESRESGDARANVGRRISRARVHQAAYRPKPDSAASAPVLQLRGGPSTLVIYAENGIVKSRVEPWL